MKRSISFILVLLVFSPMALAKQIIGIYEKVALPVHGLVLTAKIDSGARNSSLHAVNIKLFQQNDREWVSFDTVNGSGGMIHLSAPVHRIASVKRHSGKSQKRPVVIMSVCIDRILRNVEVNLIDRSILNHPLLIGRSYLEGRFLIDVSKKYLFKPNC